MKAFRDFRSAWVYCLKQIQHYGTKTVATRGSLTEYIGVGYVLGPGAHDAEKYISHPELRHDYHERINPQIEKLLQTMKEKPSTKNGIIPVVWPTDLDPGGDPPCLGVVQIFPRETAVDLAAYTRSSDVFNVLPFDVAALVALRDEVAGKLGRKPGKFIHTVGSAHYYEKDETGVNELLSGQR
jgi:thymidylate synthase